MAIRAPDDTLFDFGENALPRDRTSYHVSDVHELIAEMIEIQYADIVLAAIHTRMLFQIRHEVTAIAFPISLIISPALFAVLGYVLVVIPPVEFVLARFAVG
jgi:hypothetical protein